MRVQMQDKGYLIKEALGESRSITPEGFLLCRGVAIARTGIQVYKKHELPMITADATGEVRIERLPEEVFRPEAIASFEGKAITVYHPDNEFVTPENWKRYSVGVVQNVRRGDGLQSHLLLADLLIQSADAIAYANKELPQLSAGYDAEYVETAPGRGLQRNIIGNHVALLPRGRCGPCCAIKDEEPSVKKPTLLESLQRILNAVRLKDTAALTAELEQVEVDATVQTADAAAAQQFTDRVSALETGVAEIRNGFEELKTLLTRNSAAEEEQRRQAAAAQLTYTADQLREIVARTEILAPGISIPTTDALAVGDTAQQLMRCALEKANGNEAGAECIKPFLMGRELKVLTGDALQGVFSGAAELMRVRNNQRAARGVTKDSKPPMSADDINKANAEFWAARSAQS